MTTANLTADERRLLTAMATAPKQRGSDARVLRAAGMTTETALRTSHAARVKLGLAPQDSLRGAAVVLHLSGALATN